MSAKKRSSPATSSASNASGASIPPAAPDAKPGGGDATKKEGGEKFGELIMSLGVAVLLALLIKFVLVEIFVIPTGSMEPTLHGRTDGGDRILCTKVNYLWRTPKRWEVFVFQYPYEQAVNLGRTPPASYRGENFIKRCVGLPGEEIRMAWGDLYARQPGETGGGTRLVKPDSLQRHIWIPVYEEDFADLSDEDLRQYWDIAGSGTWGITRGGGLQLQGQQDFTFRPLTRYGVLAGIPDRYVRRQVVRFRCPSCGGVLAKTVESPKITGRCLGCGEYLLERHVEYYEYRTGMPSTDPRYAERFVGGIGYEAPQDQKRPDPFQFVPDLRFLAHVRFAAPGSDLHVDLMNDKHLVQAVFVAGEEGVLRLLLDGRPLQEVPLSLPVGVDHVLEAYFLDGEARVFVNGEALVSEVVYGEDAPGQFPPKTANVAFSTREGKVEISRLQLDRDIYYMSGRGARILDADGFFRIGAEAYMALGDNVGSSSDSREWGMVPAENLRGPAIFVFWPPHRIRWID